MLPFAVKKCYSPHISIGWKGALRSIFNYNNFFFDGDNCLKRSKVVRGMTSNGPRSTACILSGQIDFEAEKSPKLSRYSHGNSSTSFFLHFYLCIDDAKAGFSFSSSWIKLRGRRRVEPPPPPMTFHTHPALVSQTSLLENNQITDNMTTVRSFFVLPCTSSAKLQVN